MNTIYIITRGPWTLCPVDRYASPDQNRGKRRKVIKNKCKIILIQFSGKKNTAKHNEPYFFSLESSGKALFQTEIFVLKIHL